MEALLGSAGGALLLILYFAAKDYQSKRGNGNGKMPPEIPEVCKQRLDEIKTISEHTLDWHKNRKTPEEATQELHLDLRNLTNVVGGLSHDVRDLVMEMRRQNGYTK